MYKLLRNFLFLFPPEGVHHFTMNFLRLVSKIPFIKNLIMNWYSLDDPRLQVQMLGLPFRNRVGLAAGFDKNARYLSALAALGFGFIEIGTVTPLAQPGNPRPRLFRLKKDAALINRMGFNNDGAQAVANRLKKWKREMGRDSKDVSGTMLVGGNIGKNKSTANEDAWKDYEICFETLFDWVDFFVVNVSSPNTPGLRALQDKDSLRKILVHLQALNAKKPGGPKPILLKIAPDLEWPQLDDVIDLAQEIHLDGLVVANTTIGREGLQVPKEELDKIGAGGLSGLPLNKRSTEILEYIHQRSGASLPLIASGGIFTAEQAVSKIRSGASLVQVWTGFIYMGPSIVKKILKGLIHAGITTDKPIQAQ